MKKVLFVFLLLSTIFTSKAQYTDIINSKRPGFSESPYGIGTDVFQFETGLIYRDSDNEAYLASTKSIGGELFFRYGKFFERLEMNAKIAYQKDELNGLIDNINTYGISELTIGAKYLIYQQEYTDKSKEIRSWKRRMAFDKKRLIPSVGIYAGLNTNFLGEDYKDEGISYKAAILLQNDFTDRLILLTNLIADKISSENEFYAHIITLTYAVTREWSFFVENQGNYKDTESPQFQFGIGAAYLYSRNLQFDASIRTNMFDDYNTMYGALGVAWRLDRHSDEIINKSSPRGQLMKKKRKKKFLFF